MTRNKVLYNDCDNSSNLTDDIDNEVVELEKLLVSLEESMNNISAFWKGDSADAYLKKLGKTYEELYEICRETEAAANDFRREHGDVKL